MIYSIDARGNILLEVISEYFKLNAGQMFRVIADMFNELNNVLKAKDMKYEQFKSALIPNRERREILLVFDRTQIKEGCYGYSIFSKLIKLFERRSINSFLCGDYIDIIKNQNLLREVLCEQIGSKVNAVYKYSNHFFMIYINNVGNRFYANLQANVRAIDGFVDVVDLTFSSRLKEYVSFILCTSFVKCANIIVMGHEDDRNIEENVNMTGYPFEESGYCVKSIPSSLYGAFLSYKIERRVFEEDLKDIGFSINAISRSLKKISILNIKVDEKKMQYLKSTKSKIMSRINLLDISAKELEMLIKEKIRDNYIFNLSFLNNYNVCKFNTLIEFTIEYMNKLKKQKVLLSLEYNAENEELRLITLY